MALFTPSFNPDQFELRNYTNPYLTEEQSDSVTLVEQRVNGQFDWLAQMLGWNGPEYWTNLASTVAQKRRLLSGTFGVYNSFIYPAVISVKNWDPFAESSNKEPLLQREIYNNRNKLWIILEKDERIQTGQELYIGDYSTTITSIIEEGDTYVVPIEGDTNSILNSLQSGTQLKVSIPEERPFPFYRPEVLSSGDATFHCSFEGENLILHPLWDSKATLPYIFNFVIAGSTYWFDQPVYVAKDVSAIVNNVVVNYPVHVAPQYDDQKQLWYVTIPEDLTSKEVGTSVYLVWLFSSNSSQIFCTREVNVSSWKDPSDWFSLPVLNNFWGTWGNKGGFLPFNHVFDSLDLNGFDETKSVYLPEIENRVSFDDLLNFVYYQRVSTEPASTPVTEENQVWWDSQNGSFSVWRGTPYPCGNWEEILYPEPPVDQVTPEYVYPNMEDFRSSAQSLTPGIVIEIDDISGLDEDDNIIGVLGELVSPARLKLFRSPESPYWTPVSFSYQDELDFDADSENLPYLVPVRLENSSNLGSPRVNYEVTNLKFVITNALPVDLFKVSGGKFWEMRPVSSLKYIGNTRLFASNPSPVDGALYWNYDEEDEELRRASVYYYSGYEEIDDEWVLVGSWVDINTGLQVDPPETNINFGSIIVYCNGELVIESDTHQSEDFLFTYETDSETGEFVFSYSAITFKGTVVLPKIEISDSLTGLYRYDISKFVFSGIPYYMSPNVLDSSTTLRIWKPEDLQVFGEQSYEREGNYSNGLVADQNCGPGLETWNRYFLRLPPYYERNGSSWQKVALVCQNFGYWGSSIDPEDMQCPSEDDTPRIYEQVVMLQETPTESYVMYSEPYLFSDVMFADSQGDNDYENASLLPSVDVLFDEFDEGTLRNYEPLHERRAIIEEPVGPGFGDWEGIYLTPANCIELSGYLVNDLLDESVSPREAPLWDASIYKLPLSCEVIADSYKVDVNHYKVGYAYFAADLSAAEEGFFDLSQPSSWRNPSEGEKTSYKLPGVKHFSLT